MNCKNLQENLALYIDESLDVRSYAVLDEHLSNCSVCQNKLAEYQFLQNNLRNLSRPQIPNDLAFSVQSAVVAQINKSQSSKLFNLSDDWKEFLQFRVMPYSVGTVAALIFSFSLLFFLLSAQNGLEKSLETAKNNAQLAPSKVMLTPTETADYKEIEEPVITQKEYASARFSVSGESPSINPSGALAALTKSMMRGGKMNEDEVVVVADVFSNGLATISSVVEAPNNQANMKELEKALSSNPEDAPFVPSRLDKRPDYVQVVLKIQRVDVVDDKRKR